MTRFFGFLLVPFLQVLLLADDPNVAGAPPDDAVVLQIDTQPPSKIAEYKLTGFVAEEELHQPRKLQPRQLQQTGADPVDDSDGGLLEKHNKELQIRKEEIERAVKGAFFTSAVSIGAMVSILIHPATLSKDKDKQITLLDVSLVSFFASLVTGVLIPLFNICSCINIPLRFFRSMECATYFLLLSASLAAFIHFMGIMCTLFALALVLVAAIIAYYIVRSG